MFWNIVFFLLILLFVLYVVFSLSSIKAQLNLMSENLGISDEIENEGLSNDEIEKELENELKN